MNIQNEDQNSQDNVLEKLHEVQKKPKISYTKKFPMFLSDLDICKKLPSGFDESILSEFEDASQSIQDRPKNPGSFSLQGFRRNEYGSSPPARGDSSKYLQGTNGRWESHTGWSDRDSDSQPDKDTAPDNSFGNPPEAFQRPMEMELQANSKQIQAFRAAHNHGIYRHELDIHFPR